ncbi:MAG: hypothetical protein ACLP8S_22185 [Solirubrobacteraceae bacterium]
MFRLAASQIRSWWSASTADILGGDLPPALENRYPHPPAPDSHYPHSQRPPLRFEYARRLGAVPPRSAICISPVRARRI